MAALGTSETVFWSPYIAQIYAQRVARTHFQTVSVRGSEKFVWWADSFRPLNAYAHALFRERRGSLRHATMNLQGGGRWFETSIAHFKRATFCRENVGHNKMG